MKGERSCAMDDPDVSSKRDRGLTWVLVRWVIDLGGRRKARQCLHK